jgi:hypothetical protein
MVNKSAREVKGERLYWGRKALPAAHEKVVFKRDHFVNNRKP